MKKRLNEALIHNWLECPLKKGTEKPGLLEGCLLECLTWALRTAFSTGAVPEIKDVRKHLNNSWKLINRTSQTDPRYWDAVRTMNTAAARIRDFMYEFEVVHPLTPYHVVDSGIEVEGQYSLIRKRLRDRQHFVLVPGIEKGTKCYPNPVNLVQHLHARRTNPGISKIGIYEFFLVKGVHGVHRNVDDVLARTWVSSILERVASDKRYPVPGPYCSSCTTKPCLEVFHD